VRVARPKLAGETMTWIEASLILFGGLVALMGLGLPVAFGFLAINIAGALMFLGGEQGLSQLARNAVQSVTSFSLTPIPFFVLMGEVLFHSGVALKAIDAFALLIRRVPGRLAVIAIVAGTVFSAISGSTIATTALLGSLLLPTMLDRGYDKGLAMGPIIGIGGVDMLIPPSALAVLLGSLAGISISGLLIGGIVPGLILSVLFVGYIVLRAWLNPSLAPEEQLEAGPSGVARWTPFLVHVLPLVLIFGMVVGAMTAGWATPTEAAALGAAGTIIAAWLYRSLSLASLMNALTGTVAVSGTILFIIIGATTFSQVLSFSGATNGIVGLVSAQGLSATVIMIGMMAILLFLGCFVDQVSMMLITLPFFMPLVQQLGVDPIWFGVLFLICMQLGLLTPPFGLLLFTMKGVAPPSVAMNDVFRAAMPYVCFGLLALLLVFGFPPLATWLPGLLGG
jgi:tripartite ATP-independent transporter DctM subunit